MKTKTNVTTLSSFQAQLLAFILPPLDMTLDPKPDVSPMLQQARESILMAMLRTAMVLGAVIYIVAVTGVGTTVPVFIGYTCLLIMALILGLSKRLTFDQRVNLGATMLFALSMIELFNFGLSDDTRLYYLTFLMFLLIFKGLRAGVASLLFGAAVFYLTGVAIIRGLWSVPHSFYDHAGLSHPELVALVSDWTFVAVFLTISVVTILNALQNAWQSERDSLRKVRNQSHALAESLQRERETLETVQHQSEALEASLLRETQLVDALQVSLDRERELSDMRSRIITTISHEFRTPLTIINNSIGLLDRYSDHLSPEKSARYFTHIRTSAKHLCHLIEDVETVGQRNTMVDTVIPERMSMQHLCQTLQQHLVAQARSADRLHFYSPTVIPSREINTDKIAIYNVLHQLVDNALKYSDADVIVTFTAHDKTLQIDVCDAGIGIEAREQQRIFELLERGANAETISGLGIGLYIAKQVTELLDGTLQVSSKGLKTGSCFTLCVPVDAKEKAPSEIKTVVPERVFA